MDKTETTTTSTTTTYSTTAQDGAPLYAVVNGDITTVHYEATAGFVIATFPTATLAQLAALITAVIAATDPVQASGGDTTAPTDPGTTDPSTTDPSTTDPGTTDPGTTDPGTTDPSTTDPSTTDPGTTETTTEATT